MAAPWAAVRVLFEGLSDNGQAYILDMMRENQDLTKTGTARENYTFYYIVDAKALESDLWLLEGKLPPPACGPTKLPEELRALLGKQWGQPRDLIVDVDTPKRYWDLREDTWALRVRTVALHCVCA
jgi:hypothetical protein